MGQGEVDSKGHVCTEGAEWALLARKDRLQRELQWPVIGVTQREGSKMKGNTTVTDKFQEGTGHHY
eukprot:2185257-Prorocentrum_lima.AAC.1